MAARCRRIFQLSEALPGVGHKTASVVMSQAFGHPAFPGRYPSPPAGATLGTEFGQKASVRATELDLKRLFPKDTWNRLHLQIIFYGRAYCTARGCNGTVCRHLPHVFPPPPQTVSDAQGLR